MAWWLGEAVESHIIETRSRAIFPRPFAHTLDPPALFAPYPCRSCSKTSPMAMAKGSRVSCAFFVHFARWIDARRWDIVLVR